MLEDFFEFCDAFDLTGSFSSSACGLRRIRMTWHFWTLVIY